MRTETMLFVTEQQDLLSFWEIPVSDSLFTEADIAEFCLEIEEEGK